MFQAKEVDYVKVGRSLIFNLKDPENSTLRSRIFTQELSLARLVRLSTIKTCSLQTKVSMDSTELASDTVKRDRQAKEEQAKKSLLRPPDQVIIKARDGSLLQMTHSGSPGMINDSAKSKDTLGPNDRLELENPHSSRISTRSNPTETLFLDTNDASVAKSTTPTIKADASLSTRSQPPPISLREVNNTSLDRDRAVWKGTLIFDEPTLGDLKLSLSMHHINGPYVEQHLPPNLFIQGRMKIESMLDFLPKLDTSTSRNRTVVYFDVTAKDSASDTDRYLLLSGFT